MTSSKLQRFKEAMQLVYGPFETLPPESAATWTPPDSPGAGGHRGRYLWTDAFGVINLITLHRETGGQGTVYLTLARRLAETVHDVLGRTRDGTARLPRATPESPLAGGLRIGKPSATGPDADGQYLHYLTLWMFALNRLAIATGEQRWNDLAVQLAEATYPAFARGPGGSRLVWKVSTDLDTVLVGSEGHLDAATAEVVCGLLRATAADGQRNSDSGGGSGSVLVAEEAAYARRRKEEDGVSPSRDALDLGMGLWAAHLAPGNPPWAAELGTQSLAAAAADVLPRLRGRDARLRLAFREFGLALGVECFAGGEAHPSLRRQVQDDIVSFWETYLEESLDEEDLRPISLVMYAAALIPGAFKNGYLDSN